MTDQPFEPPASSPGKVGKRLRRTAWIATSLGIYDFVGGFMVAWGSLFGSRDEQAMPDLPMYSPDQLDAMEVFMASAITLEPVTGGLAAGIALVGVFLYVTGFLLRTRGEPQRLATRWAFATSAAADGVQLVWALVWCGLMWAPMVDFAEAIVLGLPDAPPDAGESSTLLAAISLATMFLLAAVYYAGKIALAAYGGFRLRAAASDAEDAPASATREPPRQVEEGLSWATSALPTAASSTEDDVAADDVAADEDR